MGRKRSEEAGTAVATLQVASPKWRRQDDGQVGDRAEHRTQQVNERRFPGRGPECRRLSGGAEAWECQVGVARGSSHGWHSVCWKNRPWGFRGKSSLELEDWKVCTPCQLI